MTRKPAFVLMGSASLFAPLLPLLSGSPSPSCFVSDPPFPISLFFLLPHYDFLFSTCLFSGAFESGVCPFPLLPSLHFPPLPPWSLPWKHDIRSPSAASRSRQHGSIFTLIFLFRRRCIAATEVLTPSLRGRERHWTFHSYSSAGKRGAKGRGKERGGCTKLLVAGNL